MNFEPQTYWTDSHLLLLRNKIRYCIQNHGHTKRYIFLAVLWDKDKYILENDLT